MPNHCNSLTLDLKRIRSQNVFKNRSKEHVMSSYNFYCTKNNCWSYKILGTLVFSHISFKHKCWIIFKLKSGFPFVLWPHCWTSGCFLSLIHQLLYSKPSCVNGDNVKTSPDLSKSTGARNNEYCLGYLSVDIYSSQCFLMILWY